MQFSDVYHDPPRPASRCVQSFMQLCTPGRTNSSIHLKKRDPMTELPQILIGELVRETVML